MVSLFFYLFLLLFFLLLESFFALSESAFVSVNKAKLFRKAKENDENAKRAKKLLTQPELLFSTTVVGTTLAVVVQTSWTTYYIHQNYGEAKLWLGFFIVTPLVLIFGEFIPKFIARGRADELCLHLSRPLEIATLILFPITRSFISLASLFKTILSEKSQKGFFLSREEVKAGLAASRGSDVTHSERQLIEKILELNKINVREMLRPLIDVIAIEESETIEEALKLLNESGHSKLPVYRERIDKIVGVLVGYHCLQLENRNKKVKELMMAPNFVPMTQPLDELLIVLRAQPMAIVVNEFGGAEGIVTMEDLIEEVVGEIEDEYDEPPKFFYRVSENTFSINARMELDDLENLLKVPFPKEEDFVTLGGFLLKQMQKIPKKWDTHRHGNLEFIIQSATDRSIEEVYVIIHKPHQSKLSSSS